MKVILPVAKFHERHWKDETVISKKYTAQTVGGLEEEIAGGSTAARQYKVQLDDNWSLTLWTPQEALDWLLDQGSINTGTLLTTEMYLKFDAPTATKVLTIDELETKLKHICMLLSFANGGLTGPVILTCFYADHQGGEEYTRFYAPLVTPIEQLGYSWLTDESDLGSYLRCCSSLEKMMRTTLWSDSLPVILIWYFQAIQLYHNRYLKPWQVAATALGSALERMCTTLCEEIPIIKANYLAKENKANFYLKDRIKAVLAHIGLLHVDGYHDNKLVDDFIDIRNDATHSKQKTSFSRSSRYDIILSATQWLEEMLLWRLGYYGEHRVHTATGMPSQQTKYSLSKREPTW